MRYIILQTLLLCIYHIHVESLLYVRYNLKQYTDEKCTTEVTEEKNKVLKDPFWNVLDYQGLCWVYRTPESGSNHIIETSPSPSPTTTKSETNKDSIQSIVFDCEGTWSLYNDEDCESEKKQKLGSLNPAMGFTNFSIFEKCTKFDYTNNSDTGTTGNTKSIYLKVTKRPDEPLKAGVSYPECWGTPETPTVLVREWMLHQEDNSSADGILESNCGGKGYIFSYIVSDKGSCWRYFNQTGSMKLDCDGTWKIYSTPTCDGPVLDIYNISPSGESVADTIAEKIHLSKEYLTSEECFHFRHSNDYDGVTAKIQTPNLVAGKHYPKCWDRASVPQPSMFLVVMILFTVISSQLH